MNPYIISAWYFWKLNTRLGDKSRFHWKSFVWDEGKTGYDCDKWCWSVIRKCEFTFQMSEIGIVWIRNDEGLTHAAKTSLSQTWIEKTMLPKMKKKTFDYDVLIMGKYWENVSFRWRSSISNKSQEDCEKNNEIYGNHTFRLIRFWDRDTKMLDAES